MNKYLAIIFLSCVASQSIPGPTIFTYAQITNQDFTSHRKSFKKALLEIRGEPKTNPNKIEEFETTIATKMLTPIQTEEQQTTMQSTSFFWKLFGYK